MGHLPEFFRPFWPYRLRIRAPQNKRSPPLQLLSAPSINQFVFLPLSSNAHISNRKNCTTAFEQLSKFVEQTSSQRESTELFRKKFFLCGFPTYRQTGLARIATQSVAGGRTKCKTSKKRISSGKADFFSKISYTFLRRRKSTRSVFRQMEISSQSDQFSI